MEGGKERQLLDAAERGDLKAVESLSTAVNINCADTSGWNPLIHAAFGHHLGTNRYSFPIVLIDIS